jgi:hypothetical protein
MKLTKNMSITETVLADIEKRAAAINTPIRDVLDDAGIDWSTWWRWKQSKSSPTLGTLQRVTKSLEARERKAKPKAA